MIRVSVSLTDVHKSRPVHSGAAAVTVLNHLIATLFLPFLGQQFSGGIELGRLQHLVSDKIHQGCDRTWTAVAVPAHPFTALQLSVGASELFRIQASCNSRGSRCVTSHPRTKRARLPSETEAAQDRHRREIAAKRAPETRRR